MRFAVQWKYNIYGAMLTKIQMSSFKNLECSQELKKTVFHQQHPILYFNLRENSAIWKNLIKGCRANAKKVKISF